VSPANREPNTVKRSVEWIVLPTNYNTIMNDTNRTNNKPDMTDSKSNTSSASRRDFLKATAGAGAFAAGIGSGFVGSVAAGIPTPQLTVDGNLIKDPRGNTVKLRGVNIADPKRIDITAPARGKNTKQIIDMLTNEQEGWYPRVIRIPVQPTDIGEHPPGPVAEGDPAPPVPAFDQRQLESYLTTHLDPVVEQCKEANVYCIVDYHRHWKGVQWGSMNSGINTKLQNAVLDFWKTVAPRYGDMNHVFFEIYNEPTKPGMYGPRHRQWVHDIWNDWKEMAQPWVDEVRQHSDNLVIIGSPGWTQTPEGASMISEFNGKNLSYAYHTYPGHAANTDNSWEEQGGHDYSGMQGAYEEVPVFATEFGWQDNFPGYGYHRWIRGTTDGFGEPLLNVLESHPGIHWTAWCADPIWLPAMFKRGFESPDTTDSIGNPYEGSVPTHCENLPCDWELRGGPDMGVLIKETLAQKRNDGVPAGSGSTGDGGNGGNDGGDGNDDTSDGDSGTGEEEQPQTVRIRAESVSAGGTTEASITLSNAPNGLAGFKLKVSVEDTSIATIENASLPSTLTAPGGGTTIADDGSSVTLRAADLEQNIQDGATDITLATVTLNGHSTGQTEVVVAVQTIDDDAGSAIPVSTTGAMLTVEKGSSDGGSVKPIEGETPTDVDNDGTYEDVNGNGQIDYNDIVVFINHMNEPVISEQVAAYDYNGNGRIDFADVVSLFQEVQ
jgi:endoglucanase